MDGMDGEREAGGALWWRAAPRGRECELCFFWFVTHLLTPPFFSARPSRSPLPHAPPSTHTHPPPLTHVIMNTDKALDGLAKAIDTAQPKVEEAVRKALGEDAAKKVHDVIETIEHKLQDPVSGRGERGGRGDGVGGRADGRPARCDTFGTRAPSARGLCPPAPKQDV